MSFKNTVPNRNTSAVCITDYGSLINLRNYWDSLVYKPNPTQTFSWFRAFWYQMAGYGPVACLLNSSIPTTIFPCYITTGRKATLFGIRIVASIARNEALIGQRTDGVLENIIAAFSSNKNHCTCLHLPLQLDAGSTVAAIRTLEEHIGRILRKKTNNIEGLRLDPTPVNLESLQ